MSAFLLRDRGVGDTRRGCDFSQAVALFAGETDESLPTSRRGRAGFGSGPEAVQGAHLVVVLNGGGPVFADGHDDALAEDAPALGVASRDFVDDGLVDAVLGDGDYVDCFGAEMARSCEGSGLEDGSGRFRCVHALCGHIQTVYLVTNGVNLVTGEI